MFMAKFLHFVSAEKYVQCWHKNFQQFVTVLEMKRSIYSSIKRCVKNTHCFVCICIDSVMNMLDGTNSLKKFQITEFNFVGGAGPVTINGGGPWSFAWDAGKKSVRTYPHCFIFLPLFR